jgi:hypothetical protein
MHFLNLMHINPLGQTLANRCIQICVTLNSDPGPGIYIDNLYLIETDRHENTDNNRTYCQTRKKLKSLKQYDKRFGTGTCNIEFPNRHIA